VTASAITSANVARSGDPRSVDFFSRDPGLWPIEERLIREFTRPPPASILDLGCGAGRTTHGLRRAGWKTYGLDLSEPLLRSAQRRFPDLPLLQADATALTFAAHSFDAVLFSFNGLDYLYPEAARQQCVTEVFRVLRPGGYFYLRGYWNALKMLTAQVGAPHWREWYLSYQAFGGPQYFFSAPPGRTVRTLQHTGFVVDDVRGASGERRPRAVLMHQAHVYFVARKPAA
jgi:SAM-dependent methyltransferase